MGNFCTCRPQRRKCWRVLQRNFHRSHFAGRRKTRSDRSTVRCMVCGSVWRTKAAYVASIIDARTEEERFAFVKHDQGEGRDNG
jgi:uncharacterized Zn finger protein